MHKVLWQKACLLRLATVLYSVLFIALLIEGQFSNRPAIDELGHLAGGISHWQLRRFEL